MTRRSRGKFKYNSRINAIIYKMNYIILKNIYVMIFECVYECVSMKTRRGRVIRSTGSKHCTREKNRSKF